jgi:acetyl-CoA synthetase
MTTADAAWHPSDDFLTNSSLARLTARLGFGYYEELRRASIEDVEWFWGAVAEDVGFQWLEQPERVLDRSRGNAWPEWFPHGVTNLVLSCVDRHDPARLAYLWEGEEGTVRAMSFGELSELVSAVAGGLRARGVRAGDRVGLYLPLVPEALASLYACAKVGAVAVPMFSGFAPEAVAARLRLAEAKLLVTADGFFRRGKSVDLGRAAVEAASAAPMVEHVAVFPRLGEGNWEAFLDAEPVRDAEPVPSNHPFLLAFTSGTTGAPKGAVHTHAGLPLKAATEVAYHADQRDGELFFWMTDLGWIVAPLIALGTGMLGRPMFLYDGAADHPRPSRVAELVGRHSVAILGASPTWARSLMRRSDHGFDEPPASLRVLASSGEPWSDVAWRWFFERVGGSRCPIVNLAGGTEAGSLLGVVPLRPLKACSFNSHCLGVDVDVVGADGQPVAPGELGELVVRQPWVGQTRGFWRDDDRYLATYWNRWPGVWAHGDWASRDAAGFWYLHGRSDDTINVAGKRVGPAEVESVLAGDPRIADCAAIGVPHAVKGEAIWCFVVLTGVQEGDVEEELRSLVAARLGRAFTPERVVPVAQLPRTRSAKVVRRAVRAAVTGANVGDVSSLENPDAIDEIRRVLAEAPPPLSTR